MQVHDFRKSILATLITSSLLVGCGGSSSEEPEQKNAQEVTDSGSNNVSNTSDTSNVTTPVTEGSATEQDFAISIAGDSIALEQKAFELTANVSETEVASYAWSHDSSLNITMSGSESATLSATAPDIDADHVVNFTVVVTNSNGVKSQSTIQVTVKRKVSSVTLTGLVTDKPINNAKVDISVGSEVFSTTADSQGAYSVLLEVDESQVGELVTVFATGVEAQQSVSFVSQLNSVQKLVSQAGEDAVLDDTENFSVNVTNVTTAEHVLMARFDEAIESDEELAIALTNVDVQKKIDLATLIKVFVDNDDIDLPEGVESTLDLIDDDKSVQQAMAIVNEKDPTLFDKTRDELEKDEDLIDQNIGSLVGGHVLQYLHNYDSPATHLALSENGKGQVSAINTVAIEHWEQTGNSVTIELASALVSQVIASDSGLESVYINTLNLTVLGENEVYKTVEVEEIGDKVLPNSDKVAHHNKYITNLVSKNDTLSIDIDELTQGQWYLDRFQSDARENKESYGIFTFSADGKVIETFPDTDEEEELAWRIAEDGVMELLYPRDDSEETGTVRFWFTKAIAGGYTFVSSDDEHPDYSHTEYGIFINAQPLEEASSMAGRWVGEVGRNTETFIFDLLDDGTLNVNYGSNNFTWETDFIQGEGQALDFNLKSPSQQVECTEAETLCLNVESLKQRVLVVEDDMVVLEREFTESDDSGYQEMKRELVILNQEDDLKLDGFNKEFFSYTRTYYLNEPQNQKSNQVILEPTIVDGGTVYKLGIFGETHQVSLVEGQMRFKLDDKEWTFELIEYAQDGITVCNYEVGQSCETEMTWLFNKPE
ncbi:hypothetical protein [Pseudoalteromonas sp. Of7M-16]|uniref:PKD domain-containing protein n=1 Tax=Pseudoalteromonas sp. Of7M-16 TaxID=2917756 RepID=UPI001EF4CE2E|nr:hypothetical protein [Pseudoalteromonas sp. Of7M-16]MCG7548094.1 hypothetical protein [Pseudoalteromonas sp. Of7M-16]